MKKISLLALLLLSLNYVLSFAQESQESNEVHYHFFKNTIPSDFNYPLIGFVNNVNGNHKSVQIGIVNSTTGDFGGLQEGVINSIDRKSVV